MRSWASIGFVSWAWGLSAELHTSTSHVQSSHYCEDKNDASVKSTQDFHSSSKNLMFEDQTIRGGVGVKKMENDIEAEFADLPDPVYACKPECRCGFHNWSSPV